MALNARKTTDAIAIASVTAHNAICKYIATAHSLPHADTTSTPTGSYQAPASSPYLVTAATASNLATVKTLANDIKAVFNVHLADTLAHKAAGTAESTADATDQTTANALLNAIKAALNTHDASTAAHYTADTTNTVATADAEDLATSIALANALKTKVNAHIQASPGSVLINLTSA